MYKTKVYEIGDLKAYICKFASDKILENLVEFYPLNYIKKSHRNNLYKTVLISSDIDYHNVKIGGIYYRTDNVVIINGGILGIVDGNCNIYLNDKYKNQFVSIVIGHELIHYILYNKFDRSLVKPIAYKFYKTFWEFLVKPEYLDKVADANLGLALGVFSQERKLKQYIYFRNFLNIVRENDIIKPDYRSSIIVLNSLILGKSEIRLTRDLERAFEKAYVAIYDGLPKRTKFGQELLDITEIFACASQTYTNKARSIVKRLIKRF